MLLVRAAPTRREGVVRAWWGIGAFQAGVQYWLAPNVGPALLVFAVVLAALWLPWGWAVHRFLAAETRGWTDTLTALTVVPSAWTCAEAARSWQSLGGPWALLGTTQWKQPALLASASIAGVWLTGFLIAASNTAIVVALLAIRRRATVLGLAAAATAAACVAVGPAWYAVRPSPKVVGTVRVAIVQAGVMHDGDARLAAESAFTDALAGTRPDLVVWGESAVDDDPGRIPSLRTLSQRLGADLLVDGSVAHAGTTATYNAAVLVGPDGVLATYAKIRLVPFGEYIPVRQVLGWVADVSRAARVNRIRTAPRPPSWTPAPCGSAP
jgi:apolipoprotein N-acyltransferase